MKKTVWIVDDDADMRSATQRMFQILGYDLREFADGRDVTRVLLGGESPDLLFLDLNMPEVSGLDILQFIRIARFRPGVFSGAAYCFRIQFA